MTYQDSYAVLGVTRSMTMAEIREIWRQKTFYVRQGQTGTGRAHDHLKALNSAYTAIKKDRAQEGIYFAEADNDNFQPGLSVPTARPGSFKDDVPLSRGQAAFINTLSSF